jgi:hypothetical protein
MNFVDVQKEGVDGIRGGEDYQWMGRGLTRISHQAATKSQD